MRPPRGQGRAEATVRVDPASLPDLDSNCGLLQSGYWACFRQRLGWQALAFACRYRRQSFFLLVLVRRLWAGRSLAYIPHGPELEEPLEGREELLIDLAAALRPHLPGCLFLRFDLPWGRCGAGNPPRPLQTSRCLRKAPLDIQPPATVLLDLEAEERDLLAAMKGKTRYNIRLAEKKGVRVSEPDSPAGRELALADWYRLYRETARRDRITLHGRGYYSGLFSLGEEYGAGAPQLHLLLAYHEGELLAGIVVALRGARAWYLYGASSDRKRNLMPAYALQWQAIRLAKERGCRSYDFFGIPPDDDPRHPMHGLYRFKTGFGGTILNRYGCYDLPFSRPWYAAYRAAETLRRLYFRFLRKWLLGLGSRSR